MEKTQVSDKIRILSEINKNIKKKTIAMFQVLENIISIILKNYQIDKNEANFGQKKIKKEKERIIFSV